jgi:peptidoglycan/LPS O-acetylase OafA/YrhL
MALFNSPAAFFFRGNFAVLLFFTLSGYVLTLGCIRNSSDTNYVRAAASKRYIRLGLPIAAAVGVSFILLKTGIYHFNSTRPDLPILFTFPGMEPGNWEFLRAAVYESMLRANRSPNYVTWSISIEFYGSIAIFLSYAVLGNRRTMHTVVSALLFLVLITQRTGLAYYSFFFAGATIATLFATIHERISMQWPGKFVAAVSLLGLGCYLGGYHDKSASYEWLLPTTYALKSWFKDLDPSLFYPGIGSILVIIAPLWSHGQKQLSAIFANQPFAWMGKMSFSAYLLHPFAIATVGTVVYTMLGNSITSMLLCAVLVTAATYCAAYFFERYVDRRSVALSDRFGRWLFPRRLKGFSETHDQATSPGQFPSAQADLKSERRGSLESR